MRILVDVRHLTQLNPAGVGGYTQHLLRALFAIDQKNEYVLFSTGNRVPTFAKEWTQQTHPRVSTLHLSIPNKLVNLRSFFLKHPTINWRSKEPIDLIFLPNLNITTLPEDIPTVLTIHDLSWISHPEFYSKKMQLWHKATRPQELVAKSKKIIVPSSCTQQDLERHFQTAAGKTHVIAHGVAPQFSSRMQSSDHGIRSRLKLPKRFVLFVGTIEPRKNLLALIEGIKQYRESTHDDLHLVIVGSWGWRSHALHRRLWRKDVSEWIHHKGYLQSQELPAVYRCAVSTVFPSIYEGFGLPILESFASGIPVITSHTSSLPEVGANACLYIDPYNSRDITEALRGLLGSSTLQKQLAERGLDRAKQFSWERTALETLKVFNNIGPSSDPHHF
ncbi:glycosyltransferase family 4 protein [Candidatus Uhrbacteria bacterium]|nr:glycosyltransferase family 4 protein [Candidatus Uhrbacteria bacterium]